MGRIAVFAVGVAALLACGESAASTTANPIQIVFGIGGGNTVPSQVTIEPTGRIHSSGFMQPTRHRLTAAKTASLSRLVRYEFASGLKSRQCPGTNPDIGWDYIRALGRTVRVHGNCEPRFQRLWTTLAAAVRLHPG